MLLGTVFGKVRPTVIHYCLYYIGVLLLWSFFPPVIEMLLIINACINAGVRTRVHTDRQTDRHPHTHTPTRARAHTNTQTQSNLLLTPAAGTCWKWRFGRVEFPESWNPRHLIKGGGQFYGEYIDCDCMFFLLYSSSTSSALRLTSFCIWSLLTENASPTVRDLSFLSYISRSFTFCSKVKILQIHTCDRHFLK